MNVKIKEINSHKYLEFEELKKYNINHAFVGKNGKITFKEICDDLDFNYNKFCRIKKQSHTHYVETLQNKKKIYNKDALITNKKNIPLVIKTSDCNSIIIFDPKKEVIANVHSGWRGTIKRILINTIEEMKNIFDINYEDLIVCFFPSIRECHFEVDEDVKEKFEKNFEDINVKNYIKKGEIKYNKQKYLIDTTQINKELLLKLGVKKKNIYTTDYCTVCNNDLFYSYRKGEKKSNFTIIEMKGK